MFKSTILPAAAIVIAGLLLGLGFNGVRPKDSLKLTRNYFMKIQVADSASQSPKHGFTVVTLDEVIDLYQSASYQNGEVVFVDARNDEHFEEGHVPGAIHIDRYNSDDPFEKAKTALQLADTIVLYCGGGECEDSIYLASELVGERDIAIDKIRLFEGGLEEWEDENLETESGLEP
ncbi:MAG: rhodanese-like domain-containing protein [Phycisphaerae bacterium]